MILVRNSFNTGWINPINSDTNENVLKVRDSNNTGWLYPAANKFFIRDSTNTSWYPVTNVRHKDITFYDNGTTRFPSTDREVIRPTYKPAPIYKKCNLRLTFKFNGYFSANPDAHFAIGLTQTGDITTQVSGRGFVIGNLIHYQNPPGVFPASPVTPAVQIETFMGLEPVANYVIGAQNAVQIQDDTWYILEGYAYDPYPNAGLPEIAFALYNENRSSLLQYQHWVDDKNLNVHNGEGFLIGHVFGPASGWSATFKDIITNWEP